MEYEGELYAERLRREAQADDLASGRLLWTDELAEDVRIKLHAAWEDAVVRFNQSGLDRTEGAIAQRTIRSIAVEMRPYHMRPTYVCENDHLLSLIEASHEVLTPWEECANNFRADVNRILGAHLVAFHLHANSRLVPVESQEMHTAVVEPTLYLLHSQPRFAAAENAYQEALAELRNRNPANAITDAGTALQDSLSALGCTGNTLGALLKSAKEKGLVRENESPLADSIPQTVRWATKQRNAGEVHSGDPDYTMSDAWMMVHVVGALIIRLSESGSD